MKSASGLRHHSIVCVVQVVLQSRQESSGKVPGRRTSFHTMAPWAVALAAVGLVILQKKA